MREKEDKKYNLSGTNAWPYQQPRSPPHVHAYA